MLVQKGGEMFPLFSRWMDRGSKADPRARRLVGLLDQLIQRERSQGPQVLTSLSEALSGSRSLIHCHSLTPMGQQCQTHGGQEGAASHAHNWCI